MGISQKKIDAEIASLRELRRNASLLKKTFFPNDIARELDSFIDNYQVYPLYRAIDNCKENWVDTLSDFRKSSDILLFYYKYFAYLETSISERSRSEVFANLLLAVDLQAAHDFIVTYSVKEGNRCALEDYTSAHGHDEPRLSIIVSCLPRLTNPEIIVAWEICKELSLQQVNNLLVSKDIYSTLSALLKLKAYLLKNQVCVDSIISSSSPLVTVTLIQQLFDNGYFSYYFTAYAESLLVTSHKNAEDSTKLLESTCAGLKLLSKITDGQLVDDFKEKVFKYAEIIFDSKTDMLWQYVPLNILEQLYQVIFSICEDEDVILEEHSEVDVKQSIVVSALLDIKEVLFSPAVLLSGEYDDLLYPQACVEFIQMGVCLNDISSRTQFDIKSSDPLSGFRFLPFLIRANIPDYNCVVLAYCRLPEVKELFSNAQNSVSGISVTDVVRVAKEYNQEVYLKLCKINKENTPAVSVAELSFVISSIAIKADSDPTKLRCYTY